MSKKKFDKWKENRVTFERLIESYEEVKLSYEEFERTDCLEYKKICEWLEGNKK